MNKLRLNIVLSVVLFFAACAPAWITASVRGTWTDEAATAFNVRQPLADIWSNVRYHDVNPPGSYFLWWAWGRLGSTLVRLRVLSGLFFGLAAVFIFQLGWRLHSRAVGLLGAIIFMTAPLSLFFSAQVRYPMLLTWLLLAAAMALWRLAQRGTTYSAIVWAILCTAAAYVHYFAFFIFAAFGIFILVSWKQLANRRKVVIAILTVFLLYAPWLKVVLEQLVAREASGGGEPVSKMALLPLIFVYLTQGYSYWSLPSFWHNLIAPNFAALPAVLVLPFLIFLIAGLWEKAPEALSRKLTLCLSLVPLGIFVPISFFLNLFAPHYFLSFWPFLSLLAAYGVVHLWRRSKAMTLIIAGLFLIAAAGGQIEFWRNPNQPENWRPIAQTIFVIGSDEDAVLLTNLAARVCYQEHKIDPLPVYHVTMAEPGKQVIQPRMAKTIVAQLAPKYRRLFWVYYYPPRFDPGQAVEKEFMRNGFVVAPVPGLDDPRVGLKVVYLRGAFEPGGLSSRIDFPVGEQHPTQVGFGWYPSHDRQWWTAKEAHVVLPFPESGAVLDLVAQLPLTLFGKDAPQVAITMNGIPLETRIDPDGRVKSGPLPPLPPAPWVALKIECSATFVPDEIFHDGDRNPKCLLVEHLCWTRP